MSETDDIYDFGPVEWAEPTDAQETVWIISGIAAGLAIVVTIFSISEHYRSWSVPRLQPYFVAMLTCFLLFPLTALAGLLLPLSNSLFVAMRFWTTAYMLLTFLNAHMAFFGAHLTAQLRTFRLTEVISSLLPVEGDEPLPLSIPAMCVHVDIVEHPEAISMFLRERIQFPVKLLSYVAGLEGVLAIALANYGHLGYGSEHQDRAWLSLVVIFFVFALWAMFGLALFVRVLKPVLLKPIPHFLSVAIPALLFPLQEIIVGGLATSEDLDPEFDTESVPLTAATIMNMLICCESLLLAILFVREWGHSRFVRSGEDWAPPTWVDKDVVLPGPELFSEETEDHLGAPAEVHLQMPNPMAESKQDESEEAPAAPAPAPAPAQPEAQEPAAV